MPESQRHLLLVDDEAPLREAVAEQLSRPRLRRRSRLESGEDALAQLAEFAFDIIITDLRLPGIDGSAVVDAAVGRYPDIIAIVVTGYGTVKDAVEAIKRGAWDFVSKPFQIRRAAARARLGARAAPAEIRERVPARAARRAVSVRRHRRQEPRDGEAVPAARDRRADQQHDSHHRRDRHRQGSRRARDSPQQPAPRCTASSRSTAARFPRRCSKPSSSATCAARSPARSATASGPPRAGAQRDAVPRRSRDDERRRCR